MSTEWRRGRDRERYRANFVGWSRCEERGESVQSGMKEVIVERRGMKLRPGEIEGGGRRRCDFRWEDRMVGPKR